MPIETRGQFTHVGHARITSGYIDIERINTKGALTDECCEDCGNFFYERDRRYKVGIREKRTICGLCFVQPRSALELCIRQLHG